MGFLSALAVVASIAYQAYNTRQQKKAQRKAEKEAAARADAAKGFSIAVEGQSVALPVQYGRGVLGGVRVYHNTSNSYVNTTPAANSQIFKASTALDGNIAGTKHEFLIVQQAICLGGISSCYTVDVNELKYDKGEYAYGLKIHLYHDGNVVDPLVLANTTDRANAYFTNACYATAIFRLNRDDPNFNGVPNIKFYIEGQKVHSILGTPGSRYLSPTKTYSNNSALCLLDYLLNPLYGRGLALSEIDLDSFYDAYLLCEKEVQTGIPLEGKFWTAKGGTRSVKLYECNISLSTNDSIRTNINKILDTMEGSELIWSGGKYRLSLEYPEIFSPSDSYMTGDIVQHEISPGIFDIYRSTIDNNTNTPPGTGWINDVISRYLSDDDIIRTGDYSITWPNAQSRLNFASVRFLNEAKDFSEDSVGWPSKVGTIGGPNIDRGTWNSLSKYNQSDKVIYNSIVYQLKAGIDRVSATTPDSDSMWQVYNDTLVYNIYREQDNQLSLESDNFENGITDYYHALAKAEQKVRVSRDSIVYKFPLTPINTDVEPGDLIKVNSNILNIPGEIMRVEEARIDGNGINYITAVKFDARHLAWNAKDNEVVEPRNIFNQDVEQVNNLRFTAYNIHSPLIAGTLKWDRPDDNRVSRFIVKYTTTTPQAIDDNTLWYEIDNTSNTKIEIPPLYGSQFTITVVAVTASGKQSPRLNTQTGSRWPLIQCGVTTTFVGETALVPVSIWKRSASIPSTPVGGEYSFNDLGLTNIPTGWSGTPPSGSDTLYISSAVASIPGGVGVDNTLDWSIPALFQDTSISVKLTNEVAGVIQDEGGASFDYTSANGTFNIFVGLVDHTRGNETTFSIVNETNCEISINNINGSEQKGYYAVDSLIGSSGSAILRCNFRGTDYDLPLSIIGLKAGYNRDLTPPPAPTGITTEVSFNNVFIEQATPSFTQGHGYSRTEIWTSLINDSNTATLFDFFSGTDYSIPIPLEATLYFWFKWISLDGVSSIFSVGFDSTAGSVVSAIPPQSITNVMIQNAAIDEAKIADAAITNAKIANIIQSADYSPGLLGWKINKAGEIEANNATFRGTLNVKSAGTGQRMEITNSVIKIYDSGGVLRVQLGDLSA